MGLKRKIMFRAWDGQRFYYFSNHAYVLDYNDASGWGVHPNTSDYDKGPWTTGESSESAEHFDLQQYTGIEDKNKKGVYEGDIVRHHEDGYRGMGGYDQIDLVYWREEICAFELEHYGRLTIDRDIEVIGNIHQNPELVPEWKKEE